MPKKNFHKKVSGNKAEAKGGESARDTNRQGPVPEIGILFYNKSKGTGNLTEWKDKLYKFVGTKYGRCQDFIKTGAYHVPPYVRVPSDIELDPTNDPHAIKLKAYQKAEQRRDATISEMKEDYPKIFNIILG